jgi:hypothetical protein
MLAVFAVLTGVARVVAVAGCERGISNEADQEWQGQRQDQNALAHRVVTSGTEGSVRRNLTRGEQNRVTGKSITNPNKKELREKRVEYESVFRFLRWLMRRH